MFNRENYGIISKRVRPLDKLFSSERKLADSVDAYFSGITIRNQQFCIRYKGNLKTAKQIRLKVRVKLILSRKVVRIAMHLIGVSATYNKGRVKKYLILLFSEHWPTLYFVWKWWHPYSCRLMYIEASQFLCICISMVSKKLFKML